MKKSFFQRLIIFCKNLTKISNTCYKDKIFFKICTFKNHAKSHINLVSSRYYLAAKGACTLNVKCVCVRGVVGGGFPNILRYNLHCWIIGFLWQKDLHIWGIAHHINAKKLTRAQVTMCNFNKCMSE